MIASFDQDLEESHMAPDIRPEKKSPREGVVIKAADGALRGGDWKGSISADALDTGAFMIFVSADEPGKGPDWHVHPYDELFIITKGRARFKVGDKSFEVEEGDVVMGPANVPHKYKNCGTGPLQSIDIHLSREWIQTDLQDPEAQA
jgi:mannose-6-phosphate isomerase-like protein (cupin superfamily)